MANYCIDFVNGLDTNSGTLASPWKSLDKVNAFAFLPGDSILFNVGKIWVGSGANAYAILRLLKSGTQLAPILFDSYGSGLPPIIDNHLAASQFARLIELSGAWNILQNLNLKATFEAGIRINVGADHIIIQNCEISLAGMGMIILGAFSLIKNNYIHDMHMIVNTQTPTNDDSGANGIVIKSSNNEVSNNRFLNCIAPSFDYGTDGGAVELYGNTDNNYIHDNMAENCNGFLEASAPAGSHAINNVISHNFIKNCHDLCYIHFSDFISAGFSFINNLVVQTIAAPNRIVGFLGQPATPDKFMLAYNVFYIAGTTPLFANNASFEHHHNIFFISPSTQLGFIPDATDVVVNLIPYDEEKMTILQDTQALMADIDAGLTTFQQTSTDKAAEIVTAQAAKDSADASITVYQQLKTKCQEIITLLTA